MTDDFRSSVVAKHARVIYLTSLMIRRAFRFAGYAITPAETNLIIERTRGILNKGVYIHGNRR